MLNEYIGKLLGTINVNVSCKRVTSTRFSESLQGLLILKNNLKYRYSKTVTNLLTVSIPSTQILFCFKILLKI